MEKALKLILDSSFYLSINANDFFAYATADAVELCPIDLKWVLPIVEKYEKDGLYAVMSYIEDCLPLQEYQSKKFFQILNELKTLQPPIYSKIDEWTPEQLKNESKKYNKSE